MSQIATSSEFAASAVFASWGPTVDTSALMAELTAQAKALEQGDASQLRSMMLHQAVGLQMMQAELARQAAAQTSLGAKQALMNLALKAQSAGRQTIQVLLDSLKPGSVSIIHQANVAHTQQINNNVTVSSASAPDTANQNELIARGAVWRQESGLQPNAEVRPRLSASGNPGQSPRDQQRQPARAGRHATQIEGKCADASETCPAPWMN